MTETLQPKALMLEPDPGVSNAVEKALTQEGWLVTLAWDRETALSCLDMAKDAPFALVIAGLGEGHDGIATLEAVRESSPVSRRMLLLPQDASEALVDAVNTTGIHACMTYPVDPVTLTGQATLCLEQFKEELDHIKFRRLIRQHNKKMYEIARNLKKKDHSNRQLLDEKHTTLSQLEYDLRQLVQKKEEQGRANIAGLISEISGQKTPERFSLIFQALSTVVEDLVTEMGQTHGVDWSRPGADAVAPAPQDPAAVDALIQEAVRRVREGEAVFGGDLGGGEDDWADDLDMDAPVEAFLDLVVEDNGMRALIQKRYAFELAENLSAETVEAFLTEGGIVYGRVEKETIASWLDQGDLGPETLVVATAKPPEPCQDGSVTYHFKTDVLRLGKMRKDGSIDFRVREEVPFAEEGGLLAEKIPPISGRDGVNVLGEAIQTPEPLDPPFLSGHGTRMSDDGLQIFAADNGQPHVDHLGSVTVNPEFVVAGDVDFQTGNIDFKGNIIVKGRVKEGFSVTGVNLTANEVEGAIITLSGDLTVVSGIRDSTIRTVGNINTTLIHNSSILGFGDFNVTKEIIDSDLMLSGRCLIPAGHVIASTISAKNGVEAGRAGTPASKPPVFKVGTEKHIVAMLRNQQKDLDESLKHIEEEAQKIAGWKKEDQALKLTARETAGIQARCQEEIAELKSAYLTEKQSGESESRREVTRALKRCFTEAKDAARELKLLFDRQDALNRKIKRAEERINAFEQRNIKFVDEKKRLIAYAKKGEADASVVIHRSIIQGTRIRGCFTERILEEDKGPCKIREEKMTKDEREFHLITVNPLS